MNTKVVFYLMLSNIFLCLGYVQRVKAELTFNHLPPLCDEREEVSRMLKSNYSFSDNELPQEPEVKNDPFANYFFLTGDIDSLVSNYVGGGGLKAKYGFPIPVELEDKLKVRWGGLPEMEQAQNNCPVGLLQCLVGSCTSDPDGVDCKEIDLSASNNFEAQAYAVEVSRLRDFIRKAGQALKKNYHKSVPRRALRELSEINRKTRKFSSATQRYIAGLPSTAGYAFHCDPRIGYPAADAA